jgi:hypothetical protein
VLQWFNKDFKDTGVREDRIRIRDLWDKYEGAYYATPGMHNKRLHPYPTQKGFQQRLLEFLPGRIVKFNGVRWVVGIAANDD